jgi:rubrerythrin
MAKPKLSDFKKFIDQMTSDEMREEFLKLFNKLSQVQAYYAQELLSPEDRKKILEDAKAKIYKQFWTRGDNPRVANNNNIRKIINDFENLAAVPKDVIELILYHVNLVFDHASQFGGGPEANFNTAILFYEKALKIIHKEQLESFFKKECLKASKRRHNMESWPFKSLEDLNEQFFKKNT